MNPQVKLAFQPNDTINFDISEKRNNLVYSIQYKIQYSKLV
jgi:hypothetical protein